MADGTLFCDRNVLYAASKEATSIGEGVRGKVGFGRGDCEAAAAAHEGFWVQSNLRAVAERWERNVGALAEKITAVGAKLKQTADAYQALDHGSAERFRGLRTR